MSEPAFWVAHHARRLAAACVADHAHDRVDAVRLEVNDGYLGHGYGHATAEGARASEAAARFGLLLDGTYTAKTFAAARDRPVTDDPVLYWHTLSSAPIAPLLEGRPTEAELPSDVRAASSSTSKTPT